MRPTWPGARRMASRAPATYGAGVPPASWRITSRSSGIANTTSVETTKLGSRTECTCVPATFAPRASGCPLVSATGTSRMRRGCGAESLGKLTRCAAWRIGLPSRGVVDDLALRQVRRDEQCCCLRHRGGQREVAGGDHADACRMRGRVDLVVVRSSQTRCADHHMDTTLDRCERMTFRGLVGRELDEHVDPVEGCSNIARHDDSAWLDAPGSAEVLTGGRACDRAPQLEVRRGHDGLRHGAPSPTGGASDAYADQRSLGPLDAATLPGDHDLRDRIVHIRAISTRNS